MSERNCCFLSIDIMRKDAAHLSQCVLVSRVLFYHRYDNIRFDECLYQLRLTINGYEDGSTNYRERRVKTYYLPWKEMHCQSWLRGKRREGMVGNTRRGLWCVCLVKWRNMEVDKRNMV